MSSLRSCRWTPAFIGCAHIAAAVLCASRPADAAQRPAIRVVVDDRPREPDVVAFERHVLERLAALLTRVDADVCAAGATAPPDAWQCGPASNTLTTVADRLTVGHNGRHSEGVRLRDAIGEALTRFDARLPKPDRWVVVIAEGNDGGSVRSLAAVRRQAGDGGVHVLTLLVATHRSQVGRVRQFGYDMVELAHQTGGDAYDLRTDADALDRALKAFERRLRHQP